MMIQNVKNNWILQAENELVGILLIFYCYLKAIRTFILTISKHFAMMFYS